jgi:surface antigen
MKITVDPVIAARIRRAWNALPSEQRTKLAPMLLQAHQQAIAVTRGAAPAGPAAGHGLSLAVSVLSNDQDGVLGALDAGLVLAVDGGGEIWGTGKYEQLDPGWLEALAEWLEHLLLGHHAFVQTPVVTQIPDAVRIAMAGDWGTGDWRTPANPAPSTDVGAQIGRLDPQITIHLGDVYYAGTRDEEALLLAALWPEGSLGSWALNSNHEMYSGAGGYFTSISSPRFGLQGGCSYFALENAHWVIVGLDSAYFAAEATLYRNGALFADAGPQPQVAFLQAQIAKQKGVIVLTHHNGLAEDGTSQTALWQQVTGAFAPGGGPAYWYWGHVHAGVVYQPQQVANTAVRCRCCGHGALPCGEATDLANKPATVLWYENRLASDPDIPQRVLNGFAVLDLSGADLRETFYDENGTVAWSS